MQMIFEGIRYSAANVGCDDASLEQSKMSFVMRFSSKEFYEAALREHQADVDATNTRTERYSRSVLYQHNHY